MPIRIYNSASQQKEDFVPLSPKRVNMYVCGPTVYDLLHVGNFRGPIFFNLVRNWFERSGFEVHYVLNFTDVDDRIIEKANKNGLSPAEVSEKYIQEYLKDFLSLKLKPHTKNPKVTEHMPEIISLIESLIAKGHAYVVEGEVLYSIDSFESYGKLSGRKPDELVAGIRVEVDQKKKNPLDFSLWKPAKPGEPAWPSPWGPGRPGWHIECSAMACAHLGETIDIHGGGMDLLFPHHENEIAQTEGATRKPFVRYWMHNNMITFGSQKMSKSLGNVRTARSFLEQYNGEILKFLMLSAHYRSLNAFSDDHVKQSIAALAKFYSALSWADQMVKRADTPKLKQNEEEKVKAFESLILKASENFAEALNDDFNTPVAFAVCFEVTREFNARVRAPGAETPDRFVIARLYSEWMKDYGQLMSLFNEPAGEFLRDLDDRLLSFKGLDRSQIDEKVRARSLARQNKDFAHADLIRSELKQLGIELRDHLAGTDWEVEK